MYKEWKLERKVQHVQHNLDYALYFVHVVNVISWCALWYIMFLNAMDVLYLHSQKPGWIRKWEVSYFNSQPVFKTNANNNDNITSRKQIKVLIIPCICLAGVWCSPASSVCLNCAIISLRPGSAQQFSHPVWCSTNDKTLARWGLQDGNATF